MKDQLAIQQLLLSRLGELQRNNPRYSLRSFAKKVGVHVGALSSILSGKRNVSKDFAERVAKKLLLDPQQRSEILSLFPEKKKYRKAETAVEKIEPRYLELSAQQFKIVSEWEHFAVMSLLNCADFNSTPKWIGTRLGVSEFRAKTVIDRLLELELLQKKPDGNLSRAKKSFRTSDDIANLSLKKSHEQSLDLAKESLYRDSVEVRDFTSITMAIDLKKLNAAKELTRKFQDEMSDLLETGDQTEVYRLSMQLFPLSKLNNEDPV